MTVQELITALAKMDPNLEVRLDYDDYLKVTGVKSEADYMTAMKGIPADFSDGRILPENSVFLEVE